MLLFPSSIGFRRNPTRGKLHAKKCNGPCKWLTLDLLSTPPQDSSNNHINPGNCMLLWLQYPGKGVSTGIRLATSLSCLPGAYLLEAATGLLGSCGQWTSDQWRPCHSLVCQSCSESAHHIPPLASMIKWKCHPCPNRILALHEVVAKLMRETLFPGMLLEAKLLTQWNPHSSQRFF